ncbi:MAG TPA: ABC transporter substrate-binding protein [Thermomicrobiales bacterium]|nr:ABC transporter substrate-binding protein [Thermomicrobiales bacterium]
MNGSTTHDEGATNANAERRSHLQLLWEMTGSRRRFLAAAAAAGLIPVLGSARAVAAQDAQPARGGTFVTISQDTIESLSPEDSAETAQWVVIAQMFDGLYNVNENYELEPVLADSYEASPDGKTYTFKVKSGVKFHNGDEFTSADVKYTYDWILDPKNGSTRSGEFELVDSVEAPDATTVVVNLKAADVTFMVNVAPVFIFPSKYHAQTGEDAFKGKPVGTGPFKLKEWIPAQNTTLDAYDDYFRGRANFDEVRVDVVPEAAGRAAALESGQADNSIWALNAEDNDSIKSSGDFKIYETLQNAVNHFVLNNTPVGGFPVDASATPVADDKKPQEQPFLSEVAVRQALLHALDRQSLADDIFKGQAQVATSNLSPAVAAYYNPDVPKYDFDPDAAKKLLDDAGWTVGGDGTRAKNGNKASFTLIVFQGDTQRRPEAELAQQWWKDIGVECKIQEGITTDTLDGMVEGRLQAALFNWVYGGGAGEPDARDTLSSHGADNFCNFRNAEVDQLLDQGIVTQDHGKRVEIYNRIQEIVAEQVPFLYLLVLKSMAFFANRIKGLPDQVLSSDNLYPKLYKFWISE